MQGDPRDERGDRRGNREDGAENLEPMPPGLARRQPFGPAPNAGLSQPTTTLTLRDHPGSLG